MAAMRRESGGMVVALVIFILLAVMGLGCAIWFYQQLSLARQAIRIDQEAFAGSVYKVFQDNGWEMKVQSPSDLGVRFTKESYDAVALKLANAAEYEKAMKPLLGWESLEMVKSALAGSPIHLEATKAGEAGFRTVRGLLERYEVAYTDLTRRVDELMAEKTALAERKDAVEKLLVETEQSLTEKLNKASAEFNAALEKVATEARDLKARYERQAQELSALQRKLQEEINSRRTEVAQLQEDLTKWKKLYNEAVAGPGEREVMVADGEVIEVQSAHDFVMVQGGKNRGVQENDKFVVYRLNPDGSTSPKGLLVISQVNEHTSLATIAKEDALILPGDPIVSQKKWDYFHPAAVTAAAR